MNYQYQNGYQNVRQNSQNGAAVYTANNTTRNLNQARPARQQYPSAPQPTMQAEKKNKKYAGQVAEAANSKARLSFVDCTSPMTDKEGDPFLNVYSKKSIYLASIIDFQAKTSVMANIPVADFPFIRKNSELAGMEAFKADNKAYFGSMNRSTANTTDVPEQDSGINRNSPAFMVKMTLGLPDFRGKTPGDAILQSQDRAQTVDALKKQASYLAQNVQKYPKNQTQIDAINDAIRMYQNGAFNNIASAPAQELSASPAGDADACLMIYDSGQKYFRGRFAPGDQSRTIHICYRIVMQCYPYRKYQYHVEIENFYAPIGHLQNGLTPILKNQATNFQKKTFDLGRMAWENIMDRLDQNLRCAGNLWYASLRKMDEDRRWSKN